jgi:serine protease Do
MNTSFAGSALINEFGELLGIGSLYVSDAAAEGVPSTWKFICSY